MEDYQGVLVSLATVVAVAIGFILPGLKWKRDMDKHLDKSH